MSAAVGRSSSHTAIRSGVGWATNILGSTISSTQQSPRALVPEVETQSVTHAYTLVCTCFQGTTGYLLTSPVMVGSRMALTFALVEG